VSIPQQKHIIYLSKTVHVHLDHMWPHIRDRAGLLINH